MTEALGAASEIANFIDFIPQLSRKIVQWRRDAKLTPKSAANLHSEISKAIDVFSDAQKVLGYDPSTSNVEDPLWRNFNDAFERFSALRCKCEELQKESSKFRFRLHPSIIKDDLQKLDEEVHKTEELLQSLHLSLENPLASSRQPGYKVVFSVPVNPTDVYLDFESKDSNGNPVTFEGALREKLLSTSSHRTVGAVAARGMGGVGKTVAMRGVALLPEAQRRFRGGIFFTSIGAAGGLSDLKISLVRMVRRAGGREEADDIQAENDFSQAVQIAAEWFCHSPCLFVFDDIWFQNGINTASLQVLFGVARHRESRLAFTSRDRRLTTLCSEAVVFQTRLQSGNESVNILLQSADVHCVPSSTEGKDVFREILKECNGLPLALSLAGAAVRSLGSNVSDVEGRWLAYREKRAIFMEEVEVGVQRKELVESVKFSLKLASADISAKRKTDVVEVFSWFRCFSVFQKQRPVPTFVLRRLWGVDLFVVETVLSTLDRYSIVQARCNDNGTIESVVVHDLVLDIAGELCAEGEVSLLSKNLLMSYVLKEGSLASADEHEMDIVSFVGVEDDGFILLNMCTLLQQSGMLKVLAGLVADPLWIVNQMHINGHDQVQRDIQLCLECLPNGNPLEGQREHGSFVSFLRAISLAVGRMAKDVLSSRWEGMVWFQLYGRLKDHAETNIFSHKLVQDLKWKAPRPWVEPSTGCLPSSSSSMAHKITLQDSTNFLCFQRFGNSLYICHRSRDVLVITFFDWDTIKTEGTYSVELKEVGGDVECACFYDRDCVILGLENGNVILLSRVTSQTSLDYIPNQVCEGANPAKHEETPKLANVGIEHSRNFKGRTKNYISCLRSFVKSKKAVQVTTRDNNIGEKRGRNELEEVIQDKDRETIISADLEKWDVVKLQGHTDSVNTVTVSGFKGGQMTSPSKDTTLSSSAKGQKERTTNAYSGHNGHERTVPIAEDRRRVVSGADDMTVRVWEKREEGWRSQTLSGHDDSVRTVAVTDDGRRVVSGSWDCTVRVWEEVDETWSSHTLSGHDDPVSTVAVTNDGSRVVSGWEDNTVRVWEKGEEGWRLQTLSAHITEVWSVDVTGDGKRVVSGSTDGTVRVWLEGEEGWWSQNLTGHCDSVVTVSVTDDGRRVLSGADDKTVRVWERGEEGWWSQALCGHEDSVRTVAVTDDGRRIVSGSDDWKLLVWEKGEEGWRSEELEGHKKAVSSVAVSADGRRVVSGADDKTVRVWEKREEGWSSETLSGHDDAVRTVAVTDDGRRVVSGSWDHSVRVWEQREGEWLSQKISGHHVSVLAVAVTKDGRCVVSGFDDATVCVWREGEKGWWSEKLHAHDDSVRSVAVTGNGRRLVSGSDDKTVRVWEKGEEGWSSQTLSGHENMVWSVAVMGDGKRVVSGSADGTVRVWAEAEEGWWSQTVGSFEFVVSAVSFRGDGRLVVSGSEDGVVRVWDKGEEGWSSQKLSGPQNSVLYTSVSCNGSRVVSFCDITDIQIWEKEEDQWSVQTVPNPWSGIFFSSVADNGRWVVSGSGDGIVWVWENRGEGWWSEALLGHDGVIMTVAITGDGRQVVSGSSDNTVRVWKRMEKGWSSQKLSGHDSSVWSVAVTENGRWLVCGSYDGTVVVWERREEGWCPEKLSGHEDLVGTVAITNDGRRVVSGSRDRDIRLWDKTEEGWSSQTLLGHYDAVRAVAVTDDCRRVVSGGNDSMVRVWERGEEGWSSQMLSGHLGSVERIAVTGDGKQMVSGSCDGAILVWEEGEEGWSSQTLTGHGDCVATVSISDDGRRVVSRSGHDGTAIRVWERGEEGWLSQMWFGKCFVNTAAVSDNANLVVLGLNDKTVIVWEKVENIWSLQRLTGHEGSVRTVAVTNDGRRVASGSCDKMVCVWEKAGGIWQRHRIHIQKETSQMTFLCTDTIEYTLHNGERGYIERDSTSWKVKQRSEIREPSCLAFGDHNDRKVSCLPFAVWEELFEKIGASDWNETASGYFCCLQDKPFVGQLDVIL